MVSIHIPAFCNSDSVLANGEQHFGQALNSEHRVFRLNDTYVIWLIADKHGTLFEVAVGPKSYYSAEFPNATKRVAAEFLSETEYEQAIKKISELKEIGQLRYRHTHAVHTAIGPMNTDHFERAFVDRFISADNNENVVKFDVYFLHDIDNSPEEVLAVQPPMVCFAHSWYYLPSDDISGIKIGVWQPLQIAGPTIRKTDDCSRTTAVRDADGFTIEQPQTGEVGYPEPFTVKELVGQVVIGSEDSPIEAANVEFLQVGSKEVMRTKTDSSGIFKIPQAREGTYKFKVTKNGFKALSGTIILDEHAPGDAKLLFYLPPA
jgi:hypothetical protein